MNDAEIIKALECCTKSGCSDNETKDCPLKTYKDCSTRLAINALGLINHQKEEIERLQKIQQRQANLIIEERGRRDDLASTISALTIHSKTAKSEVIREFAEKLKEKFEIADVVVTIDNKDIDNLVEEMTGENNG